MIPNDDFLKQFGQKPPDEFGKELLEKLKQLDNQATDSDDQAQSIEHSPDKQALVLVPFQRSRSRAVDRYITSIAAFALLVFFASILILSFGNRSPLNEQTIPSLATPIVNMDGLSQLAWTPDGNNLYVADTSHLYRLDLHLQLLDSFPLSLNGTVTTMTFVNDGAVLVLGDSSGALSLWSTQKNELLYMHQTHRSAVQVLVWVERNQHLLSTSLDGDLVVLDVRSDVVLELERESISQDSIPAFITGLTVHPNGRDVIVRLNNSATYLYELSATGLLSLSRDDNAITSMPPVLQASYSFNGERINYIWWDHLVVLDSHTMTEHSRYPLPERFQSLRPLQSSENGLRLLLSNSRSQIALWDFSSESYIPIFRVSRALDHDIRSVLHPNGRLVAAIMPSNEVHLWQINDLPNKSFEVIEVAVNRPHVRVGTSDPLETNLKQIGNGSVGQLVELFSFGDSFLTQTLWTPDGSQLIVISTSTIRVYDDNLRLLREWSLLGSDATMAAISGDGHYLITASSMGTITVWDVATGRVKSSLANIHDAPIVMLTILDSRNQIVSRDESGEFGLLHFDGANLYVQDRFESSALASYDVVDWHQEDDRLRFIMMHDTGDTSNPSDLINIVDLALGDTFEVQTTTTAINATLSSFTDDGNTLLVYDSNSDLLNLYDSRTFAWQSTVPVPASLTSVLYMQRDPYTEQILLIDYDNELYRFDSDNRQIDQIQQINALLEQPAETIALYPNAQRLSIIASHNHIVLGEIEEANGNYLFSEIARDTPVSGQIQTFITGPNHLAAASTSDGAVLIFDTITGNLLRRISLATWGIRNHDLAFNSSGTILVVLGHNITGIDSIVNILDVQAAINGDNDVHLSASPYYFEGDYLSGMAFDAEGDWLITGGSQVRTWNLSNDPFEYDNVYDLRGLTIFAHNPQNLEVATLRPGNYLRVVSTEKMLYRYSTQIYSRSQLAGTFLKYTPDGRFVILASEGNAPEIYDAVSGDSIVELTAYPDDSFSDMTLGHDGTYLFAGGDRGLFMWNIDAAFGGNTDVQQVAVGFAIQQVAVNDVGTRLFLVGQDGAVHVLGIPQN